MLSLLVFRRVDDDLRRLIGRFDDDFRLVYARLRFNVKSPLRVVLLFRVVVFRVLVVMDNLFDTPRVLVFFTNLYFPFAKT
jgi:hypothetical protein|tara:strand:- start:1555 stop:1797 length:243 start_codon:yes stop_codon:yes gene_type:complete